MERRKLILVAFLLMLYIVPVSSANESPPSISFYETLPDDVLFFPDNETHGSGYAESFVDVSDITVATGETVTTDGDLGTFHNPGDNAWDYYFWNSPSSLVVQVIEWRTHSNISSSSYEFALYSADDGGGSQLWTSGSITAPTSAGTKKYSPMVTGVESIRLATRHASSPASFIFDYLRGGKSKDSGFSHDGSTTAGVTNDSTAGNTHSISSDGDILTLTGSRDAGAGSNAYLKFSIAFDTTATVANIESLYYPFFEVSVNLTTVAGTYKVRANWDDKYADVNPTKDTALTTYRRNVAVGAAAYNSIIDFDVYLAPSWSVTWNIDYVKAYSIANNSITQSGVTTDDYLYVDAGTLYSHVDTGYIEANHDPVILSVSDTYPVYYNLTTSGTAPEFSYYVSSWSAYSAETRGITPSGTITDIKLKFDSTESISEINFIMQDIFIFSELFLSLEMWGYLGPTALVVLGYILSKKDKTLGVIMFIVDSLVIVHYLTLVEAMPNYWWHIIILLIGAISCTIQMIDR